MSSAHPAGAGGRRAGGWGARFGLVGATLAVSVSAILIQEAHSDAATVVWLRMAIAVVMLAPWAVPQLRDRRVGGSRTDGLLTVGAGLLLALHFLAWTASLAATSVAVSVLLVSLHPLIVTPVGAWLFGDGLGLRVVIGICLAVGGTVVTCAPALGAGGGALRGDLLAILGGVALAGYLIIGRGRRRRGGVAAYSAVVYAIVSAAGVATALASGALHTPDARTVLACLGLAAVCTVGGHTVFNWALHRLPASTVSLSFLGEPPLAALLAFLLLGQRLDPPTLVGGCLILCGLAVTLSSRPPAATAAAVGG